MRPCKFAGCQQLSNHFHSQAPGGSRMRDFATRNQTGSMGAVIFSAALISILGLGAFALDFSHMLAVRGELQNAADAAALAGAGAYAKLEDDQAEVDALEVASVNT